MPGVLKVPSAELGQRERLARETRILQALSHPAIVHLLDFQLASHDLWLVTPLGVTLPDWWRVKGQQLPPPERAVAARAIARTLLSGLVVVHQAGVVHRDIKPKNVIMIDDQAVLIDFGVAFSDDGERLTALDGRPVANTFAAPGAAYYGQVDDPKPWWDCLGIAWLWGWMLSAGKPPKDNRFHWKYHRMIESSDSEGVRALAAVCADEATAPPNAAAMLRLITALGLVESTTAIPNDDADFENALRLQRQQLREELVEKQSRRDRVEAAALVVGPMYEEIRSKLRLIARRAKEQGLPVSAEALLNDHPIAILLSSLKEQQTDVRLFECRATPAKGVAFEIVLTCEYRELIPNGWPLRFMLSITPGPAYPDNDIVHFTDGSAHTNYASRPTTNEYIPELFKRWLNDEAHWVAFSVI